MAEALSFLDLPPASQILPDEPKEANPFDLFGAVPATGVPEPVTAMLPDLPSGKPEPEIMAVPDAVAAPETSTASEATPVPAVPSEPEPVPGTSEGDLSASEAVPDAEEAPALALATGHSPEAHASRAPELHAPHALEIHAPHAQEVHAPHAPEIQAPHAPEIHAPHAQEARPALSPRSMSAGFTPRLPMASPALPRPAGLAAPKPAAPRMPSALPVRSAAPAMPGLAPRKIQLAPPPPAALSVPRPKAPPMKAGMPGLLAGTSAAPSVIHLELPEHCAGQDLEIIILVREGGQQVAEAHHHQTLAAHGSSRVTLDLRKG